MKKQSRLESNRDVRRVLNRHGADLSQCQYSCSGVEIRLTGKLCRTDGSEYQVFQIENIIQDFQRTLHGYNINGDLENWHFSSDSIIALGENEETPKRKVTPEKKDYEDPI